MRTSTIQVLGLVFFCISVTSCELMYKAALVSSCAMRPAIKIQPKDLLAGNKNRYYLAKIKAINASTPIASVNISSGRLAKGLHIVHKKDNHHFHIEGIPQEEGEFAFTLAVSAYGTQCVGQSGKQNYRMIIRREMIN